VPARGMRQFRDAVGLPLCDDAVVKKRLGPTFAEMVADAVLHPAKPERLPAGRGHGGLQWVDMNGTVYGLTNSSLPPGDAKSLAQQSAQVVYDACGCGGAECQLTGSAQATSQR
jgi:hypothetical protein